jgi:phosphate transport system permease protein
MNDLTQLDEPIEVAQSMREEIRRVSHSTRARRLLISRVMTILCALALAIAAVPLILLLWQLVQRGAPQLTGTFFTKVPATPSLLDPNATGGLSNAIIGSIALNIYAAVMAIPVGVLVGVFLAESTSKFASALRIIAQTMAGAPSILMGLFAFSFVLQDLHVGFSAIAGSFALAVLMLPVIIISKRVWLWAQSPTRCHCASFCRQR